MVVTTMAAAMTTKSGGVAVADTTKIHNSTTATTTTTRDSTGTRKTIHKYVSSLWLVLAGAASCSCLFSIFGPTRYMIEQHQQQQQQQQQQLRSSVIDLANAHYHLLVNPNTTNNKNNNFVPVADLKHEHLFHATIKSCLPTNNNNNKKCKEYVPPAAAHKEGSNTSSNNNNINNNKPIQRIALLSPPGDLSLHILNQMEVIMVQHNNLNSQQQPPPKNAAAANVGGGKDEENRSNSSTSTSMYDMDIFATSHVPPYGYGKTHGLTKIVRLVPHPLVLQVTNALQAVMEPDEVLLLEEEDNESNSSSHHDRIVVSVLDLKIALRQVLRFHCRLSHVAAHTALLSLDMMNILQQPYNVTNLALRNFLAPLDVPRRLLLHKTTDDDVVEMYVPDDDDDDVHENGDDDTLGKNLWDEQERMGTKMLSLVQATLQKNAAATGTIMTTDITTILDQVLIQEMQLTKNMTIWPCPSFWAAGDDNDKGAGDENVLTPLTRRLAKALSPTCNNNIIINNNAIMTTMSSCWVERDKCEAAGDAICQGNNNKNKQNNPKKQQTT